MVGYSAHKWVDITANTMQQVYTYYIGILTSCYEDVASEYPALSREEQRRDLETIRSRTASEGVSFFTKTLPSLAKAIDKALATGTVLQVPSFSRGKGSQLPRFLGWLIGRVFSSEGVELADADPRALGHIRQLLGLFYKLEMPYSANVVGDFLDEFVAVDASLNDEAGLANPERGFLARLASQLIGRVLASCDPRDIVPGHGPGSVATGEQMERKGYFSRTYQDLEEFYPLDEFFFLNPSHHSSNLGSSGLMARRFTDGELHPFENLKHSTAKVVLVPKDSRGPRLISMEPLEKQWIQQGQCRVLVRTLETHRLTRGHVNFTHQSVNQTLARVASMPRDLGVQDLDYCCRSIPSYSRPVSNDLVTIDMKEASDRVSLALVQALFPENWIRALEASRSTMTMLPNGVCVTLNKFAPMGSAVCFPVEALVFFALAVASIMVRDPSLSMAKACRRVWVYGDDIILYAEDYGVVRTAFELFKLRLNENKCCVSGSFRESCGVDAYKGVIVTPTRIRKPLPEGWAPNLGTHVIRRYGQILMSWVSYSNDFHNKGYLRTAQFLMDLMPRSIPISGEDFGNLSFVRPDWDVRLANQQRGIRTRFNKRLHRLEAFGWTTRSVTRTVKDDTYEHFFLKFSKRILTVQESDSARSSALRSDQHSVPRRVSSKRGWTQMSF